MERVYKSFLGYVIFGPTLEKAVRLRKTRVSRWNKEKAHGTKERGTCSRKKEYAMCKKYGRRKRLEKHVEVRHRHIPTYLLFYLPMSLYHLSLYICIISINAYILLKYIPMSSTSG